MVVCEIVCYFKGERNYRVVYKMVSDFVMIQLSCI